MIPSRITLSVSQDQLPDNEFVFEESAECVIGRDADCDIQIPVREPTAVSRHHCVLEMHPPHVQVRDLGSLNGTFVNGKLIGQRGPHQPLEESGLWPSAAHPLKHGDELRVGHVIFRVEIARDSAALRLP